jgi:hypothetical protein
VTVELSLPIDRFHRASIARPGKSEVVRRRMRNAVACENAPSTSAEIRLANLPSWSCGFDPVTRSRHSR